MVTQKKDFFMRTFETFKTYKLSDQMCVASYHAELSSLLLTEKKSDFLYMSTLTSNRRDKLSLHV